MKIRLCLAWDFLFVIVQRHNVRLANGKRMAYLLLQAPIILHTYHFQLPEFGVFGPSVLSVFVVL